MPDLLAALGISQLKRLDQFVARRREISQEYDYLLADLPLSPVHKGRYDTSGCHLYVVRLDDWLASRRDDVMDFLRNKGIGVNLHYLPIYLQPYYYDRIGRNDKCLNAEEFSKRIITLPLYTSLSKSEIDIVVAGLKEAVEDVSQE
jgi:dTDP-4-amino-4,6-dideoxygalactose transaminase